MRLIDADALKKDGGFVHEVDNVVYWERADIDEAPTIDPEELRPKGRWVMKDDRGNGVCSYCNRQDKIDPLATHCRYCGADMRGGA